MGMGIKKEIVYKKLNEIKPYDKNPRKNDNAVEYVANSIKKFNFQQPIIIDKDNVIVCGHTRYKAAKKLGIENVPCVVADDLTEEQIKAYRLADNKVAEKSEWDFDLLGEELNNIFDIDMEMFDFKSLEIEWDKVEELGEDTYEEPNKTMLECPHCHHIDSKVHFKKIDGVGKENENLEE